MHPALLLMTGLCCTFASSTAPAGEAIDYVKQIKLVLSVG